MASAVVLESEVLKNRIIGLMNIRPKDFAAEEKREGSFAFDFVIRKGIPFTALRIVKSKLELSDSEFAKILGISLRTLHRKKETHQKLSITEGDRLYRVLRIFALACEVLESDEMAKRWLHKPQHGLGGRVPVELIQTEAGAREVEDLLEKIEFGVIV
jgi:putative toxin-antitoxin system antitoxin component (TIGR02293 family)